MIICGDITALNSLSFALAPEQPWDNGAPNAKASIQLLPDCFRWIGEIKTPLTGKALLALALEQPGVMQRLMPKLQSSFYRIASAGLVK